VDPTAPSVFNASIKATEEEHEQSESAIGTALGEAVVVQKTPLELKVEAGAGQIAIPIEGATEGASITGDLAFTLGALALDTTDGVGTATVKLGDTLSVTGGVRLDVTGTEIGVAISDPKLRYTPPPPDQSTIVNANPDVTTVGASFEVGLDLLPSDASLAVEYSQGGSEFADAVGVTFRLEAENSTGTIEDPAEDIAFVVKVTKTGITNEDLGANRASLSVSLAWYQAKLAQDKSIVIVKQDDDGNAFHSNATCAVDGDLVHCTAEFTGNAGGFSSFGLVALKVELIVEQDTEQAEDSAVPEEPVIVPGPDLGSDPVITREEGDTASSPTPTPTPVPVTPTATPSPSPTPSPQEIESNEAVAPVPTAAPSATPLPVPTPILPVSDGGGSFEVTWWLVVLGVLGLAVIPGVGAAIVRSRS
jgi:hypothetical protein